MDERLSGQSDTPESSSASLPGAARNIPLRRGNACVRCRIRKLKCDANKPVCFQCAKARQTCQYNSGVPSSKAGNKVKALEAKVAALEKRLLSGDGSNPSGTFSHPPFYSANHQTTVQAQASSSHSTSRPGLATSRPQQYQHSGHHERVTSDVSGQKASFGSSSQRNAPLHLPSANFMTSVDYPDYYATQSQSIAQYPTVGAADDQMLPDSGNDPGPFTYHTLPLKEAPASQNSAQPHAFPHHVYANDANFAQFHGSDSGLASLHQPQNVMDQGSSQPLAEDQAMRNFQLQQEQLFPETHPPPPGHVSQSLPFGHSTMHPSTNVLSPNSQNFLTSFLQESSHQGTDKSSSSVHTPLLPLENFEKEHDILPQFSGSTTQDPVYPFDVNTDLSTVDPSIRSVVTSMNLSASLSSVNTPSPYTTQDAAQIYAATESDHPPSKTGDFGPTISSDLPLHHSKPNVLPSSADMFELSTGWYDATDLPPLVRDKLLAAFFQKTKYYYLEVDLARFRTRLTLEPRKRPHPCWLYSMYLVGAKFSNDPSVTSLEDHFYKVARDQFEKSIAQSDRLLDAIRGGELICYYLYASAQFLQAYVMSGTCSRLAMSCGLHKIRSTSITEVLNDLNTTGKGNSTRYWGLPPPIDSIDLGERIATFWRVMAADRAGSGALRWPTAVPTNIVTTPLPHDLHAFSQGILNTEHDQTMEDLLNGNKNGKVEGSHARLWIHRAGNLLHEISLLSSPETVAVPPPVRQPDLPSSCPRTRYPELYKQYTHALQSFVNGFPPAMRNPFRHVNGKRTIEPPVLTLHLYVAVMEMWLEDQDDWRVENTAAVQSALQLLSLAKMIPEDRYDEMEFYNCMLLTWGGKVLIKELKRLTSFTDDYMRCTALELELDALINIIASMGKGTLAGMQTLQMRDWRAKTLGAVDIISHTADVGLNPQVLK